LIIRKYIWAFLGARVVEPGCVEPGDHLFLSTPPSAEEIESPTPAKPEWGSYHRTYFGPSEELPRLETQQLLHSAFLQPGQTISVVIIEMN